MSNRASINSFSFSCLPEGLVSKCNHILRCLGKNTVRFVGGGGHNTAYNRKGTGLGVERRAKIRII